VKDTGKCIGKPEKLRKRLLERRDLDVQDDIQPFVACFQYLYNMPNMRPTARIPVAGCP